MIVKMLELLKTYFLAQSNKPRYLPSKEEFLKYEDDEYVEPNETSIRPREVHHSE